jgi:hypothetical protein
MNEKKLRVYQVMTIDGEFRFFADNIENAKDHIWSMNSHPNFEALSKVAFLGWAFHNDDIDNLFGGLR